MALLPEPILVTTVLPQFTTEQMSLLLSELSALAVSWIQYF